jgi:hypothetical protein
MKDVICPRCDSNLRGEPIPAEHFVHDRSSQEHLRSVAAHQKYALRGECSCLPYGDLPPEERFYSRVIGIEVSEVYDGVLFWQCPDCGGRWHRWPENGPYRAQAEPYVSGGAAL